MNNNGFNLKSKDLKGVFISFNKMSKPSQVKLLGHLMMYQFEHIIKDDVLFIEPIFKKELGLK